MQTGTVVDVGNVATNTTNTPGDTPSVTITTRRRRHPGHRRVLRRDTGHLACRVGERIPDAIVVPVSALLALKEGGYAVEVGDRPEA